MLSVGVQGSNDSDSGITSYENDIQGVENKLV